MVSFSVVVLVARAEASIRLLVGMKFQVHPWEFLKMTMRCSDDEILRMERGNDGRE